MSWAHDPYIAVGGMLPDGEMKWRGERGGGGGEGVSAMRVRVCERDQRPPGFLIMGRGEKERGCVATSFTN